MKFIFLFTPFIFYFGTGKQLSGTKWNLYSIQNDKEYFKYVLDGVKSNLEFQDSICTGYAACNGFIGPCKIEKEVISFDLSSTMRGCHGKERIVEDFIHKNFRKLFYRIDSDTLILFDQKGVFFKYLEKM